MEGDYYNFEEWSFSIDDIFRYIDSILEWIQEIKEYRKENQICQRTLRS